MVDVENKYANKEQLSEGVYVINDGNKSWGGELNYNFELLNSILAKKTLTITSNGEVLGTYNARLDQTIDIPTQEYLHHTLSIKYGDNVLGSFDDSENLTLEIPKGQLTLNVNGKDIGTFNPNENKTLDIELNFATNSEIDNLF